MCREGPEFLQKHTQIGNLGLSPQHQGADSKNRSLGTLSKQALLTQPEETARRTEGLTDCHGDHTVFLDVMAYYLVVKVIGDIFVSLLNRTKSRKIRERGLFWSESEALC